MAAMRSEPPDVVYSVPCQPIDFRLSHWDRTLPPTHCKRILCFSLPAASNKAWVADCLRVAFHNTVQRVPFLAGSVVPLPEKRNGRPWIRDIQPHGSAKLFIRHLEKELNFADLQEANFAPHLLDTQQLCPLPEDGYFSNDPVDVCRFQANFVNGGLLLVVSVIHIAADGRGVMEIINIFAEQLRKAQKQLEPGESFLPFLETRRAKYRSDRTALVSGNGVAGDLEQHTAWTSSMPNVPSQTEPVKTTYQMFRLGARALVDLKAFASSAARSAEDWISTNDVVSALIWRSIMIARYRAGYLTGPDTETYAAQMHDCRTHLKIPEPFFGNVLYMTKACIPIRELLDPPQRSLALAARALRADIRSVTADKFRDLVGYAERTQRDVPTRSNMMETLSSQGIIITSHFKFDQYSAGFGPIFGDGRIKAVRLPARGWGAMAGAVMIMPKLPDGSCEFLVHEQDETVRCLMEDEALGWFSNAAGA
ncbi:unnamed protein product [Discula destructiva]